ncbi:UDP-N-acetylmuramoyl-L-alanine--D-glutamate ligase [Novosphingobium sp. PC22D]|uniref:UDP-N-acetylmuramoyl-L-alanine--D-glutamate ligase n=1 Tax=Novosphingobium sp. PC22D TaxID=1962403 RepID=UPI000BF0C85E|nr:UDP-N-acetylmuramoyl-L-alanine--D-glutamate ligase [Novosphingobium sp. PC22D]PEQ12652.1 UDP-N-acetylmuramoyl-L-alanine--D-glutamate ligase [Novosphingobium sp. PC22D]
MITSPDFAGKRFAVLGLARSGAAAVESLLASGAQVMAWDSREEPRQAFEGRVELADPVTAVLEGYEAVVVSPGIPLNRHPIAEAAAAADVPVIGDIELFARARAVLPAHRVVGITGTNGKSTTTMLVRHLFAQAGVPVRVGGNIGVPILAADPLPEGGVYVLELSSYQIDLTFSLDCEVAVLLNVTPDHLDRYADFDAYVASKARLFGMQSAASLAIVDHEAEAGVDVLRFSPEGQPIQFIDDVELPGDQARWPSLQGPHNRQNAAAAIAVARQLGLSDAQIEAGLESFVGLPHRMERVAENEGVLYINDSKATNPASAAPALAAFPPDPRPRIHWIVGGLPKGDDLGECEPYFGNVAAAYTIGDAGPMFADLLAPHAPVRRSEMMAEAIREAMAAAKPGDVVMLSPACASFDQFRDFEARGDAFRRIVGALISADDPGEGED